VSSVAIIAIILVGLFIGLILAAIRNTILSICVVGGTFCLGLWQFQVFNAGNGDVTMINHFFLGAYAMWTAVLMMGVLAIIGIVRWWTELWKDIGPAVQNRQDE
jgi:hypothetical protein